MSFGKLLSLLNVADDNIKGRFKQLPATHTELVPVRWQGTPYWDDDDYDYTNKNFYYLPPLNAYQTHSFFDSYRPGIDLFTAGLFTFGFELIPSLLVFPLVIAIAGLASLAFLISIAIAGAVALVAAGLIIASIVKYHEYLKVNQEITRTKTVEFLTRSPVAFFAAGNQITPSEHHTPQTHDQPTADLNDPANDSALGARRYDQYR